MVHLLDERMKKEAGIIKCETLRKYRIEELGAQDWDEIPERRDSVGRNDNNSGPVIKECALFCAV